MLPLLTTERLQLRFWQIEDLPNLVQMNQDEEVMKYFLSTMSNEDSIQFYNRIITHQKKHGFIMYLRTMEDLDGYIWGIMHLDIEKFKNLKQKK